ncbi:MAG TPA: EamA family transporter, partial [Solirubrobacteraceae bacterium]|nr:EamA family transporter [Solirubrobacteraceae bacterium]
MAGARTLTLPDAGRASGIALAIAAMSTIQLGAALSEPLFERVGPAGVVALRLVLAALLLWSLARPRVRGPARGDMGMAVALGACSGLLTLCFFEAIARIPLGVAVTIEFLGPLGVALAGSRHLRDVGWVLLAGAGVALLTLGNGAGEPLDVTGVAFALLAGAFWAGYILLTKRVGARWAGLEGLSVSLAVAALVTLPAGIAVAGGELLIPDVILAGLGLALLMPLAPYAFELVALRRLPTALFGVIMSLEPAIAALFGFLILGQGLAVTGVVAIAMVSLASAGATLAAA